MTSTLSASKKRHVAWLLEATCQNYGSCPATRIWRDKAWRIETYHQLRARANQIGAALIRAGVMRGDRVAILSANMPEWTQVDMAVARIGAVLVPLYSTSTVEQIVHILEDCGAVIIFTGDAQQTERAQSAKEQLPQLRKVVSFAPEADMTLEQFAPHADCTKEELAEIADRMAANDESDLLSIVYTSGTTGDPRGVMISHRAMFAQLASLDEIFDFGPEEHSLCFLPLSHALERGWSTYMIAHGCMNTYVPDTRKVSELLTKAKPTMLVSVPKLYETVLASATESVSKSPIKRRIFDWALRVGGQIQKAHSKGKKPRLWWRWQLPFADRLVFRSVREAMGGQKTILACGGAPLRIEVEHFFSACGMQILNGYGLTEASPLVSFNRPTNYKEGTAGPVMPGGQIAIGLNSEIFYRGENVMDGYWGNPQASAEVIDDEGWLHTGDVGYVDDDGFLVITDRLKDIIVTIGGKNVSPAPIENILLADPLFEQAVLLGDNRPYLTLLIKPSVSQLNRITERLQIANNDIRDTLENSEVVEEIRRRVSELTAKLPRHEQIRDIRLLPESFTLENGLLTPSLKVKRKEVEARFSKIIEDMYAKLAEAKKARNQRSGK